MRKGLINRYGEWYCYLQRFRLISKFGKMVVLGYFAHVFGVGPT